MKQALLINVLQKHQYLYLPLKYSKSIIVELFPILMLKFPQKNIDECPALFSSTSIYQPIYM